MTSSKTRRSYSAAEKLEIIEYAMSTSQGRAAHKYGVHKSMISRWTRRLGKIRSAEPHTRRIGSGRRPWKKHGDDESEARDGDSDDGEYEEGDDDQDDDMEDESSLGVGGGNDQGEDQGQDGHPLPSRRSRRRTTKAGVATDDGDTMMNAIKFEGVQDAASAMPDASVQPVVLHKTWNTDCDGSAGTGSEHASLLADTPTSPSSATTIAVAEAADGHAMVSNKLSCFDWAASNGLNLDANVRNIVGAAYPNRSADFYDDHMRSDDLFMHDDNDNDDDEDGSSVATTAAIKAAFKKVEDVGHLANTSLIIPTPRFTLFGDNDMRVKNPGSSLVDHLRGAFDFNLDAPVGGLLYDHQQPFSIFDGFDLSQASIRVCNSALGSNTGGVNT